MLKLTYIILPVAILTLTGCATGNLDYTPPNSYQVSYSSVVDADFETVWDRLISNLSSDFFVINNLEKSSKLINVSFSSQKPSDYIDCGSSIRTVKSGTVQEEYQYSPADPVQFQWPDNRGYKMDVQRKSILTGRSNIYVAPNGNTTTVSVNVKYNLTVDQRTVVIGAAAPLLDKNTYDFSTKTPLVDPENLSCSTKGVIEKKVLDYAK